jgi:D-arginine dehydrogenase
MTVRDVVIIGAGIAGVSLAYELAGACDVLLLEGEDRPGYHSTGRSAAFWTETYGGPLVQPLTSASGPALHAPPADFSDLSFLKPRGALHIGGEAERHVADTMRGEFKGSAVRLEQISVEEIAQRLPGVRAGWSTGLWEPDCSDIDVAALHAAYLRSAKRKGVALQCTARLESAHFRAGAWDVQTSMGLHRAKLLVNAAGAWADDVATRCSVKSIGIQPYRRTIAQLAISPLAPPDLPLVIGLDESFYFKPEAGGKLWLSPHDETPSVPCDAAAEELDIAKAIDRLEAVVDWKIERVEHKWAGLRSFAPDRLPVIGRDADVPEFFWLAGQGGFGIQTAPAIAQLAASQILDGLKTPENIDAAAYDPARFRS